MRTDRNQRGITVFWAGIKGGAVSVCPVVRGGQTTACARPPEV